MPTPACLVLAAATFTALAGPTLPPETTAPSAFFPAAQQPATPEAEPLVSVRFKGGTTAEYINALREASGDSPVNVVLSESAAATVLPAFSLANTRLSTAIHAIEFAAGRTSGNWYIRTLSPHGQITSPPRLERGSPAFAIDFIPHSVRQAGDTSLESFSIQRLLPTTKEADSGIPAAKLLSAIDVALQMQADRGPKPELKYHEDSGLLFVRGTGDDIRIVGSVLARLSDDVNRTRGVMSQTRYEAEQRNLAIRDAELHIEFMENQFRQAEAELARIHQLVKSGHASTTDLSAAEARMSHAKFERERADLQLRRAKLGTYNPASVPTAGPADRVQLLEQIADLQAKLQHIEAELRAARQSPAQGPAQAPSQAR